MVPSSYEPEGGHGSPKETADRICGICKVGRMTEWKPSGSNTLTEKGITYDRNGNILTLKRYTSSASLSKSYTYAYTGNRLTGLTTSTGLSYSFSYDTDGRLLTDSRSGITASSYDELGHLRSVTRSGSTVEYLYLADGTKLAAVCDGSFFAYAHIKLSRASTRDLK